MPTYLSWNISQIPNLLCFYVKIWKSYVQDFLMKIYVKIRKIWLRLESRGRSTAILLSSIEPLCGPVLMWLIYIFTAPQANLGGEGNSWSCSFFRFYQIFFKFPLTMDHLCFQLLGEGRQHLLHVTPSLGSYEERDDTDTGSSCFWSLRLSPIFLSLLPFQDRTLSHQPYTEPLISFQDCSRSNLLYL